MKELNEIQVKLNAPKGQYNAFGKYKYRSCEDILASLKPLLNEHKCTLVLSDEIIMIGDRFYIKATATITNEKGEKEVSTAFARESLSKKGQDEAQVTGSASSYARKYALNGLFCIDDTKDPDALNTSAEYTQPTQQQIDPNLEAVIANIKVATTVAELTQIWNECTHWQSNNMFVSALTSKKNQLEQKEK